MDIIEKENKYIIVNILEDLFKPEERKQYVVDFIPGKCVLDYIAEEYKTDLDKLSIAINGNIIKDYTTIINEGDIIGVISSYGEPTSIMFVVAWIVEAALYVWEVYGSFLIMSAISYAVSALCTPSTTADTAEEYERSSTYKWSGTTNTYAEGGPIPIIYGTNKVAGQVINQYVEVKGNNQYLNILIALGHGELDSISSIKINDEDYSNFKGVTVYECLGSDTGTVFSNFNNIYTYHEYNTKIDGEATIITTDGNQVEKISLDLGCPRGCYYMDEKGRVRTSHVEYTISYRVYGESGWTVHGDPERTLIAASIDAITDLVEIDNLPPNRYNVKILRTNAEYTSSSANNEFWLTGMREIVKEELYYPGIAKYSVSILASEQLSGGTPNFTCIVDRHSVDIYNEDLESWQVKNGTNPAWATWDLLYRYGKISKDIIDWDAFDEWADFCDTDIGDGEKQAIINTVIDVEGNLWDKASTLAKFGRGVLFRKGRMISVMVDKVEDTVSHLFTMGNIVKDSFKMAYLPTADRSNCVEITYTDPDRNYERKTVQVHNEDYYSSTSIANKFAVSYLAALPREQVIRDAAYWLNSNMWLRRMPTFKVDLEAFTAVIGDLFYFQHDVMVSGTVFGGRIKDAYTVSGTSYVELDRDVELTDGGNYSMLVRLQDNTIVDRDITGYANPTNSGILELDTIWSTIPDKYDPYTLGISEAHKKKYRITKIERQEEQVVQITALEYYDEIYDTQTDYVIEEPIWELREQEVVNVYLNEFLTYSNDGSYLDNLNVSWYVSYPTDAAKWAVWIEDTTNYLTATTTTSGYTYYGTTYSGAKLVGITDKNNLVINSSYLTTSGTYRVYVNEEGKGYYNNGNNTATITIQGKLAPPEDVTNFVGYWRPISRNINFFWSAVADIDLDHYEIRYGDDWATASGVISHALGQSANLYVDESVSETRKYWIKAVDKTGIYSENASYTEVSIDTEECSLQIPTGLSLDTSGSIQSDGQDRSLLIASWDSNAEVSDYFKSYDILLEHISSGHTSQYGAVSNSYMWELSPNTEYGVSVRAVDRAGNKTSYCTQETETTAKDSSAPDAPTWPVSSYIVPGIQTIGVRWNAVSDDDLNYYTLEMSTNGTFSGEETEVGDFKTTFKSVGGLERDQSYWFRVKGVDRSGNEGSWSTIVSGTTGQIASDDIAAGTIIANHLYSDSVDAYFGTFGTVEAGVLQSASWSTTSGIKLDLDNETFTIGGSADPDLYFNGTTLTVPGLVTEWADIQNVSIETADIGDLEVTTAKIDNLAVTEGKIDSLAVTTAKIDNAAITEAKIGDLAVSTLKIAGEAVTIPRHAYTAGSISIYSGSLVTIQSVSITLPSIEDDEDFEYNIAIIASSLGMFYNPFFSIVRGSTTIIPDTNTWDTNSNPGYLSYRNFCYVCKDAVTAGTYTYYFKMRGAYANGGSYCTDRSLLVLGVAR